jgi:hypothetical protein
VVEQPRFVHGELEDFLRTRRVRKVATDVRSNPPLDVSLDAFPDIVQIYLEVLQDGRGDAFALTNEAKERAISRTFRTRSVKL